MAAAAVQHLGSTSFGTSSTTTVLSPASKTVTVGYFIAVGCIVYAGSGANATAVDNLGNTYTFQEKSVTPLNHGETHLLTAPVTVGGSLTSITVTHQSSGFRAISAAEFSGVGTLSVLGGGAGITGTNVSGIWVNNKTIPANGLAVGFFGANVNGAMSADTPSGTPSTTVVEYDEHSSASNMSIGMYYAVAGGGDVTGFSGSTLQAGTVDASTAGAVFSPAAASDAPSLRTAGTWVAATATTQTVTLPTHQTGDMLIVRVGMKHATLPGTITCDTAGWAKLGEFNNGTTASGNGSGDVQVAVFWKVATSAAETNPVITLHASVAATPSCAVGMAYQKPAGREWDAPVGAGGGIAAATGYSATMGTHVSATVDDMLDSFAVTNDNTTLTVPTVAQAGLTLAAVTESPAAALSDATSNDISADGCYRLVTAGTSSAAAVASGTNSVADVGAAWVTRLRTILGVWPGRSAPMVTLQAVNRAATF